MIFIYIFNLITTLVLVSIKFVPFWDYWCHVLFHQLVTHVLTSRIMGCLSFGWRNVSRIMVCLFFGWRKVWLPALWVVYLLAGERFQTFCEDNNNEHNFSVFYKRWKEYNEIQLTKNKMDMKNRIWKIIHPPSSGESHSVSNPLLKSVDRKADELICYLI